MSRPIKLSVEAFAHIAEAFSWYQGRRPGLGWEFDADLDRVFALLRELPEVAPAVHRDLRRALLRRFPYVVYYQPHHDHVLVRAVLHMRQRPRRWRRAG